MKFKTLVGMLDKEFGYPNEQDPGMTDRQHAQWQNAVMLDAMQPGEDCIVGYNVIDRHRQVVEYYIEFEDAMKHAEKSSGLYVSQVNKFDILS